MNAPLAELEAFRKLDTADRAPAQLRGARIERAFQVERDGIDKEARTAWLSIASDAPYERWFGIEILDMNKKSIRTERLDAGFAILVGHDTSDQVGVAMKHEITSQKKLRVQARFSRSARGEEIFQDVLDGIRVNASVGYMIHDLVLEREEEGVATYRVTDWEPYEGSLVAVPADPSVGVGRELELRAPPTPSQGDRMTPQEEQALREKIAKEEREKIEKELRDKASAAANTPEAVLQRERERVADITAAGKEYAKFGGEKIAAEEAAKADGSVESFKARMLDAMKTKPTPTAEAGRPHYGDGARQIIRHGHLRAFTKPLVFTDGSRMEPVEAAYRSGQWLLATVGQNERAQRWCRENGLGECLTRVATTDVDSAGGYVVPTEMEQSIIDLRAMYGLARRLCRRRPMGSDTRSVPKRTGGVTAYFIQEDNSGVTASDKSWGNVNFVAKTLAALSLISRNLEEDSIIDVVDDLAREQAYAFAVKEDQCWLIGDGTSTYGGMQGLKTMFEATAYGARHRGDQPRHDARVRQLGPHVRARRRGRLPRPPAGVALLQGLRRERDGAPAGDRRRQRRTRHRRRHRALQLPGRPRLHHRGDAEQPDARRHERARRLLRRLRAQLELRRPPRHRHRRAARALRREAAGRHPRPRALPHHQPRRGRHHQQGADRRPLRRLRAH
jgi:HK97 family phage major capsid protein